MLFISLYFFTVFVPIYVSFIFGKLLYIFVCFLDWILCFLIKSNARFSCDIFVKLTRDFQDTVKKRVLNNWRWCYNQEIEAFAILKSRFSNLAGKKIITKQKNCPCVAYLISYVKTIMPLLRPTGIFLTEEINWLVVNASLAM